MSLFGKIVRTTINTACLPVAIAKDAITLGVQSGSDDGKLYTTRQLDKIKREAEDE